MKKTRGDRIFDTIVIVLLLILCVLCLYPFLNQVAISFNEGMDSAKGGITIFPRKFTTENYKELLFNKGYGYGRAFMITVSRAFLNMVISNIVMFAAAYALTRKRLKGRKAFTTFFVIPMYLQAGVIPIYILYRYLGLIDNFWVYVLPFSFAFYSMVIIRSFIQEIPPSLEESALIDGANEITVLFKIILPLSLPVLATVSLWILVGQWNDWTSTLYYITDKKLYPLQYLMMQIIKEGDQQRQVAVLEAQGADASTKTTTEAVKAAMIVSTSLPIIMVYPFLQKYFVKGVTLGAVKE
ncbi:MAG: carbohydrate ABC transporter permease [Clostridia bacterium]|nr:carbohydrate ABC transporter permease [Clostridia bacterium]